MTNDNDREEFVYKTNIGIVIKRTPYTCTDSLLKFYDDHGYSCFEEVSERDLERSNVVHKQMETRTEEMVLSKECLQMIEVQPYEVSVTDFSYFDDCDKWKIIDIINQIKSAMSIIGHDTLEDIMDNLG